MGLFSMSGRKKHRTNQGSGYYQPQGFMGKLGGFVGSFSSSDRKRYGHGYPQQNAHPRPGAGRTPSAGAGSACRLGRRRPFLPEVQRAGAGGLQVLPRMRREAGRRVLRAMRRDAASQREVLPRMRHAARLARFATAAGDRRLVGRTFGAWRLDAVLGQGRFGTCFRASRASGEPRSAALKLIKPEQGSLDRDALWREAKALSLCAHPAVPRWLGIVRERDDARDRGRCFMAQSLMPGTSLDRLLFRQRRSFDQAAIASIGRQVIDALAHLEGRGVAHGDVRPANLLIDAEGTVSLVREQVEQQGALGGREVEVVEPGELRVPPAAHCGGARVQQEQQHVGGPRPRGGGRAPGPPRTREETPPPPQEQNPTLH